MSYEDYTLIRKTIEDPAPGPFNVLVKKTVELVHELKLFKTVGIKVRKADNLVCPAAIVYPKKWTCKQMLSSGTRDMEYEVGIAFGLKQPNDCIAMQLALDMSEAIGYRLSIAEDPRDEADPAQNILLFVDVPGHYNTELKSGEFGEVREFGETILAYNSGISVVYSVYLSK
jgi:hypothetical protein